MNETTTTTVAGGGETLPQTNLAPVSPPAGSPPAPSASQPPPAKGLESLEIFANTLGGSMRTADENGLFLGKPDLRAQVYEKIVAARTAIEAGDAKSAAAALTAAEGLFHDTWNGSSAWWRLCHQYGLVHHVFCALSGVGAAILLLLFAPGFEHLIPAYVCMLSVAGAVLRALFYLSFQANRRVLRSVWVTRSITGPFIAIFLAIGLYLALKAGLLVLSAEGASAEPNQYTIGFLSMCAGLFWEETMEKVRSAFQKTKIKE